MVLSFVSVVHRSSHIRARAALKPPFDIAEDIFARCAAHWKMKRDWRFRWHMTLLLGWYDTLVG